MSAATVNVTVCPPSTRGVGFDTCMAVRSTAPVSVRYTGSGEWESTGYGSFDDYSGAQTRTYKLAASRRFATPTWSVNDLQLQKVITEYLVQRANGHKRWKAALPAGAENDIEKIRWAERLLASRNSNLEKQVTSLCNEFVELRRSGSNPARLKALERLIGNIDAQIIFNRAAAAIVAGCVSLYYRQGLTSVGVASVLGLHPPAVRILLKRVWAAAVRCGFQPPEKRKDWGLARENNGERAARRALREEQAAARKTQRAQALLEEAARQAEAFERRKACIAAPKPAAKKPRVKGESTRQRWLRLGLCVSCGKEKETELTCCNACRERQKQGSAPRLAAAKAERARKRIARCSSKQEAPDATKTQSHLPDTV
jgi:hypothetical protein